MALAEFELAIPASEWPQTHVATGIGLMSNLVIINQTPFGRGK